MEPRLGKGAEFTLVQLRYFVKAAERGAMTSAAEHFHVAQSAVSAAIAHLEHQFGVQLFVRKHARGVTLTSAGEHLLREARELLRHAGEVAESAEHLGSSLEGDITFGCFVTLAPFHLPALLSDVAVHHPGLRVSVLEGEIPVLVAALHEGSCDVALVYDLHVDEKVEREVLAAFRPYVILPPDHHLATADEVRLADLAHEPMVMLDLPHSREYFTRLLTSTGTTPTVRYRSANYETVRSLVARGHGFAILNQQPHSDLTYDGGRVVARRLAGDLPALPVVLARLAGVRPTARGKALAARCREVLRSASDEPMH